MIRVKTKIAEFDCPTSYSDITVRQMQFFIDNGADKELVIENLTGVPYENLKRMNLWKIIPHIKFLHEKVLDAVEPLEYIQIQEKAIELPTDVRKLQWSQKLLFVQLASKNEVLKALSVYLQPLVDESEFDNEKLEAIERQLLDLDVATVYGCYLNIENQIKAILERENKMLSAHVTPEMKQAGIENFNQLGEYNSIRLVATNLGIKIEEALAMDYNTVFLELLHNKISSTFDTKYAKIMSEKSH